jgi:cell division protein FtsA
VIGLAEIKLAVERERQIRSDLETVLISMGHIRSDEDSNRSLLPGESASRLIADAYVVETPRADYQQLMEIACASGFEVAAVVVEPVAALDPLHGAGATRGTVVVDICAQWTGIAAYSRGALQFASGLRISGDHFTNDVGTGLGIPFSDAS